MNTNTPGREPEPTDAVNELAKMNNVNAWAKGQLRILAEMAEDRGLDFFCRDAKRIADGITVLDRIPGARPMPETPAANTNDEALLTDVRALVKAAREWAVDHELEQEALHDDKVPIDIHWQLVQNRDKKLKALLELCHELLSAPDIADRLRMVPDTPAPDEVAQLRAEVAELRLRQEGNALELGTRVNAELQDTILAANTALTARIADLERENAALGAELADLKRMVCAVQPSEDHESLYCYDTVFRGVPMNWFDARDKMLSTPGKEAPDAGK